MTIGNYDIGFLIGKGADAEVRVATEKTSSQKQFAVKILKIKSEEEKLRYKRELEVTKALSHDNIIKLYDVKEDEGSLYLFMDLIKGLTLEKFSEQNGENGLNENLARHIFAQLINAVSFIHSKGVCHRDIKLENVLIDEKTKKVILIDFGYCGLIQNDSSFFKDSVGSPLFNSPEKILTQVQPGQTVGGYCGKSADIWSLGVCLYFMLNGCYPFFPYSSYGMEELTDLIINGEFFLSPTLSLEAADLLCKLLEKNPQKRITIQKILEHPFLKARNAN